MDKTACITITPKIVLLDDVIDILVTCLQPLRHFTLACRVAQDDVRYFSYAYYRSDENGSISVKTMPALDGGSYEGVHSMGLIWSQKQEPGQKPGRRLTKTDITTPIVTHVYVLEDTVAPGDFLDLINRGIWLAHTSCDRIHMAEGVERIVVHSGRLMGTLFIPAGQGPHPGVIDLFGTVGGTVEHRSALLASRGIAAFTVRYFTPGKGVGLIADIEYFEGAIEYLLRHPKVRKPHIGIIGVSKGGELALLISSLCHQIKACVEINAIDVACFIDHSYKGELFPCVELDMNAAEVTDEGIEFKNTFQTITSEEHDKYGIPVERGLCDYLLIHGAADRCMAPILPVHVIKRLRRSGKSNYRVLMYPDTGHLIEPPHSPHFYTTYHSMFGSIAVWGGNAQQHADAQEDAWEQIIHFFKSKLGGHSSLIQSRL